MIIAIFLRCISSNEKGLKNPGLNGELNPDLCDAGAVLYQLNSQGNWELFYYDIHVLPSRISKNKTPLTSSILYNALS